MRLLNTTDYRLESFADTELPEYAILSHRWRAKEVSYQDMLEKTCTHKSGFTKIRSCCAIAKSRGLEWVWVDTCCIDKTSSAELSEAINAMFQWYQNAEECYAYLYDVPASTVRKDSLADFDEEAFKKSDWFTRGWTLQELLAPSSLIFLNVDFKPIGSRSHDIIQPLIAEVTGIDSIYLSDSSQIHSASIAQRFSWIAHRQTTRLEDTAYCLLGIFNISMPLLYGEGRRAFIRLQSEIMKQSDDESIFAWVDAENTGEDQASGLLAEWPEAFADSGHVKSTSHKSRMTPSTLTSRGVGLQTPFSHTMIAQMAEFVEITVLGRIVNTDRSVVVDLDCEDWKNTMSGSTVKVDNRTLHDMPRRISVRMQYRAGSWCRVQSSAFDIQSSATNTVVHWLGKNLFADPETMHVPQPGWNLFVPWQTDENAKSNCTIRRIEATTVSEQRPTLGPVLARLYVIMVLLVWWLSEKLLQGVREERVQWLSPTMAKVIQSCARDLALWAVWTMGWLFQALVPGLNVWFMFLMVMGAFGVGMWHLVGT